MTGRGVFRLYDMIGSKHVQAGSLNGPWFRAVPMPYHCGLLMRVWSAWEVVRGKAVAVEWPKAGDLEKALDR